MIRSRFHIAWLLLLLLPAGCVETLPAPETCGVTLTLRCTDPVRTKAQVPGDNEARENLIDWVDFFFYPGENPAGDVRAVYHARMTREEAEPGSDPGYGQASFKIPVSVSAVNRLFPDEAVKMTVLAIVNCPASFPNSLDGTEPQIYRALL